MAMTLDDTISKAATQIDEVLQHKWDTLALRLIADGVDPNGVGDEPSAADGPWSRVSFNWVLQRQKAIDLQRRTEVLEKLRRWLISECGLT